MTVRPLWTLEAMAAAMRAVGSGVLPSAVTGISIDSRTIAPGEAFFAIAGDNRDGHDFVDAAFAAGAAVAVVAEQRRKAFSHLLPLLVVSDVLEALRALARAARARSPAQVIAITGSVGKTGTKDALRLALSGQGEIHASAASYNNHWGVPLSLARCPASARYAVLEMGMNHAGEIEPLARLVRPHVGVITAVEPVHLAFLHSIESIADAKAEIFHGLERGGTAVLNRDNPLFSRLQRRAAEAGVTRVVAFGEHPEAQVRLLACDLRSGGSSVTARVLGSEISYRIGAPGRHLVLNSLAVLAATALVGADPALGARALADLVPARGRGERMELALADGPALLIDESYNANPASMRAALALLGQAEIGLRGRRIAVLGDMLELGPGGADLHAELAAEIAAHEIDLVLCCGPLMRNLWEALPPHCRGAYADDAGALEPRVLAAVRAGDAVMVKGSYGSRMAPIVAALQRCGRGKSLAQTQLSTSNG
jgi:UDP-N-acetylmuramoyl-tripeptide--D-alanyl-D-alanine ligase